MNLTQEIFKGMPSWAKSAAISGYGLVNYFSVTKDRIEVYGRDWCISRVNSIDWPPMNHDFHSVYGYIAADTTDWQNSAIDRELAA